MEVDWILSYVFVIIRDLDCMTCVIWEIPGVGFHCSRREDGW